jgi:hypothetical protein
MAGSKDPAVFVWEENTSTLGRHLPVAEGSGLSLTSRIKLALVVQIFVNRLDCRRFFSNR